MALTCCATEWLDDTLYMTGCWCVLLKLSRTWQSRKTYFNICIYNTCKSLMNEWFVWVLWVSIKHYISFPSRTGPLQILLTHLVKGTLSSRVPLCQSTNSFTLIAACADVIHYLPQNFSSVQTFLWKCCGACGF